MRLNLDLTIEPLYFSPKKVATTATRAQASTRGMAHNVSTVLRPRILCNSAAEYLETRVGEALGAEFVNDHPPQYQYVSELDKFVAGDNITQVDYIAKSEQRAAALKMRLAEFSDKIHGLDKGLNIQQKPLDQYHLQDVLDIVTRIEEKHRLGDGDKSKSFSGIVRRCFRFTSENSPTIKTLLSFAPDDVYGSVISGGLTMILGAIERGEKLRSDIYDAVAEIPRKIVEVNELLDAYITTRGNIKWGNPELQMRADAVRIAIFDLLFVIVEELTKSMTKKGISLFLKGSSYATEINDSIGTMESTIQSFNDQVKICLHERIGKMDENLARTRWAAESNRQISLQTGDAMQDISHQLRTLRGKVDEILGAVPLALQNPATNVHNITQVNVINSMYQLYAGSPMFDDRTGKLHIERYQALLAQVQGSEEKRKRENQESTDKWLWSLSRFFGLGKNNIFTGVQQVTETDQKNILDQFGASLQAEHDRLDYLLRSEELGKWIHTENPMALIVQSDQCEELDNPISFLSAFIHRSLASLPMSTHHVLGFFGGRRNFEDDGGGTTSPDGMLALIFANLMDRVKARDDINMSSLGNPPKKLPKNGQDRVEFLADRFRQLVNELPKGDVVILVLDSVYLMEGEDEMHDAALGHLLDLVPWAAENSDNGPVVKIIATQFLTPRPYAKYEDEMHDNSDRDDMLFGYLHLPDVVDGSGVVLHLDSLDTFKDLDQIARELSD